MTRRRVEIEAPELETVAWPSLDLRGTDTTLPLELQRFSKATAPGSLASTMFRDAAKLLEALRIALLAEDADDYDREHLTEGEIAITRGQQTISRQLDKIITLMKKEAEKKETEPTA